MGLAGDCKTPGRSISPLDSQNDISENIFNV